MISKGTKEISLITKGVKEFQEVFKGSKEIWSNNKYIDLGSGTSFDIKVLAPNVDYRKLTSDNFFLVSSGSSGMSGYDYDVLMYWGFMFNKSYNASTGILTCYGGMGLGGNITKTFATHMVLITKPSKLVLVSTSNIASLYPTKYQDFTNSNFLLGAYSWNAPNSIAHRNPEHWTAGISLSKRSYNASTGSLAGSDYWYTYAESSDPDRGRREQTYGTGGLYLYPKKL